MGNIKEQKWVFAAQAIIKKTSATFLTHQYFVNWIYFGVDFKSSENRMLINHHIDFGYTKYNFVAEDLGIKRKSNYLLFLYFYLWKGMEEINWRTNRNILPHSIFS